MAPSAGTSAQSLLERSSMHGYLTKMGGHGISRNWRKRFFVLDQTEASLYYFKSETDEVPAGMIYLPNFTHIEVDEKKKFCWKLSARVNSGSISSPVAVVGVEAITVDKKRSSVCVTDLSCANSVVEEDSVENNCDESDELTRKKVDDNVNDGYILADKEDKDNGNGVNSSPSRIYYAYALSQEDLQRWIDAVTPFLAPNYTPRSSANVSPVSLSINENTTTTEEQIADGELARAQTPVPSIDASLQMPPTPAPSVDHIGPAPPTPPTDANISVLDAVHESLANHQDDDSENADEDAVTRVEGDEEDENRDIEEEDFEVDSGEAKKEDITAASKLGYKISSIYTKMADLDAMMQDIEIKSKDDLKILHETMKMAYAMLQKEVSNLKEPVSILSPPPSPPAHD